MLLCVYGSARGIPHLLMESLWIGGRARVCYEDRDMGEKLF